MSREYSRISADAQEKPWERGHLALDEGWKPPFPALFPGREGILPSEGWKPSFPGLWLFPGREGSLPSEGWKPSFPGFVGMLRVEE